MIVHSSAMVPRNLMIAVAQNPKLKKKTHLVIILVPPILIAIRQIDSEQLQRITQINLRMIACRILVLMQLLNVTFAWMLRETQSSQCVGIYFAGLVFTHGWKPDQIDKFVPYAKLELEKIKLFHCMEEVIKC